MLPTVNIEAMDQRLEAISTCVSEGAIAFTMIDGAAWPCRAVRSSSIVRLKLPPYAPESKSVDTTRASLRANALGHQVWENYEAIVNAYCAAWTALINDPAHIRSMGTRDWAGLRL